MTLPNPDKWQWLEAQLAPECLEWVDQQNERTKRYIDGLAEAQGLEPALRELATGDSRNPDFWTAGHLLRLRKSHEDKRGILEISKRQADGSLSPWQKVVDIDKLGQAENQNYELPAVVDMPSCVLGTNSDSLILPFSVSGSDAVVLREVDIESGTALEDGFRTKEGRILFTWMDYDHVLISHRLGNGPTTVAGYPQCVYLWRRGTDLRDAKLVWQADSTDLLCYVTTIVTLDRRYGLIIRVKDYSPREYLMVNVDGDVKTVPFPGKHQLRLPPASTAKHVIGMLSESIEIHQEDFPAGTVVACCIEQDSHDFGKLSVVYVPRSGEFVLDDPKQNGIRASQSRVYITLARRGTQRCVAMECHNDTWAVVEDHNTTDGHHCTVTCGDPYRDSVVVEESGPLTATQIWLQDQNTTPHKLHQQASLLDPEIIEVNKGTFYSADGTEIDYFTLSPKSKNGPFRLLMTGYGAFGTPFPQTYLHFMHGGISLVLWLQSGGAFAVPYIRGGGERGEEWHQAARQEKRQRSYDDFIAVAEGLIRTGFTEAGKIGVFGTSNGGLLAAVVGLQRPDIFAAVVSDAPITDMLRYHKMATGAAYMNEYGDPEDPKMATILKRYSPYHNVMGGVEYPAFLVTVSTRDDRVGPGHARKFVARLQEAGATHAYLLEDREGGHLGSDAFKNASLMSRRVAFFLHHLR